MNPRRSRIAVATVSTLMLLSSGVLQAVVSRNSVEAITRLRGNSS